MKHINTRPIDFSNFIIEQKELLLSINKLRKDMSLLLSIRSEQRAKISRTESITRLWKFFSFPVEYIESVLDFFGNDILLAFRYLNDQERGKTMELPYPDLKTDTTHLLSNLKYHSGRAPF